MGATFVEVSSRGWAFWRACLDTCVGLVVGTLYAFLGILVLGIVGEEALSSLYREIDLDPVFRASMGVVLLAGAVLGIGVPLVFAIERFAAFRAAEESAAVQPDGVPSFGFRMALAKPPFAHLQTLGTAVFWCVAGLGGIFALGVLFTEDLREDVVSWIVLAAMVAVAVAASLLRGSARRGVERTKDRFDREQARWKRLVSEADAADAQRRLASVEVEAPRWLVVPTGRTLGRIANVLLAATFVALGAFLLSVFLRQQCRTCDPVSWSEPIETGIDVLSLASGIAIATCAAAGAIAWIGGVALQFVREIALAGWAAHGGPRRVDPQAIGPLLTGNRAIVRLQIGLCTIGAGLLVLGTGALWAESQLLTPGVVLPLAGVLILVGLVLGWTDAGRSRRERQTIRDALSPGDVGNPQRATSGRRRPRRQRR